jgi:CheY-like chemotaxis protein
MPVMGSRAQLTGEEGLRLAREPLPDLIRLDLLPPKGSGLEVLKALTLDPATAAIPVAVMSGLSQKNAARLEKDGAFAFLEKAELARIRAPNLCC